MKTTDLFGNDETVTRKLQAEAADLMQAAKLLLNRASTADNNATAAEHISAALGAIGYYCADDGPDSNITLDSLRVAGLLTSLKPFELAKTIQRVTADLPTEAAYQVGAEICDAAAKPYRVGVAAAVLSGTVDSNMPVWAGFIKRAIVLSDHLTVLQELVHTYGISNDAIRRYLRSEIMQGALTPYEQDQLSRLRFTGATVYCGGPISALEMFFGYNWTLSKAAAADHARAGRSTDAAGVLITAELQKNGVLLYLSERPGRELIIDKDLATVSEHVTISN